MPLTVSEFKAQYRNFEGAPLAKLTAAIASATAQTSEAVDGDQYEHAIGLLAAHILLVDPAVGPAGKRAGKEPPEMSAYLQERKRLARAYAPRFLVS